MTRPVAVRRGDWMQTFTGVQFWPLDPRPEDINIEDIAHALSNQCRFAGHCTRFYSVAQHSVHVSDHVAPEFAIWGLLHDAAEAYLVDLPRPVKRASQMGSLYQEIETALMKCVCERFGMSPEMPKEVHETDNILLMTEKRDLMPGSPAKWVESQEPLESILPQWSPYHAKKRFMLRVAELGIT